MSTWSRPVFISAIELTPLESTSGASRQFAIETNQGFYWFGMGMISVSVYPDFIDIVRLVLGLHIHLVELHMMADRIIPMLISLHLGIHDGTNGNLSYRIDEALKKYQIESSKPEEAIRRVNSNDMLWLAPLMSDPKAELSAIRRAEVKARKQGQ
jgi:hypothetical protein